MSEQCSACGFLDPLGGVTEYETRRHGQTPRAVNLCMICAEKNSGWTIYGKRVDPEDILAAVMWCTNLLLRKLLEERS